MKVHDLEQGTAEWHAVRLEIPTASEFSNIVTPLGKPSKSQERYRNILLAEWMTGKPGGWDGDSVWGIRGKELEPEARDFYEFDTDQTVETVGFVTRDDGMAGASPDGLVGDFGLFEAKCPAPHTHVAYMLKGKLDQSHMPQIQGQLLICGRDWCDIVAYNPDLPPITIRVERDEKFLKTLSEQLDRFIESLLEKREQLRQQGVTPLSELREAA